jgi:hypothetical protein
MWRTPSISTSLRLRTGGWAFPHWNFPVFGTLLLHGDLKPAPSEPAMSARRITLRIEPPNPFGEVTLVPAAISGRPEAEMGRAMAATFTDFDTGSASDALRRLRQAFPMAPLSARLAALDVLMERFRRAI